MRGIFVWTKVKLGSHLVVNSREPGSENMKMLGSDYVVNIREQSRSLFSFLSPRLFTHPSFYSDARQ